ncbi:MAG: hypothetical protein Q9M33_07735 [Robiginitomaculum sp.]|nr:hypothetical protein [Robiginitomaculum sp.]MDQ7078039.1 hypothetical protein [Robiginitomaculum sp.]
MKSVRWSLAIILAAFLVFMGSQKFGTHNPVFQYMAIQSGISLFEPGVRMATGLAEISAALLILWPRTRLYGALLALAVLGGALALHLSPWLGINAPVDFSEACRAAQNCDYADMSSYMKSPMLFIMALGFSLITLGLYVLERSAGKKPS